MKEIKNDLNYLSRKTKIRSLIFILRNLSILLPILIYCIIQWYQTSNAIIVFLLSIFIFHFLEYAIHRFLFHSSNPKLEALKKEHMRHHTLSFKEIYYFSDHNHAATILLGPLPLFIFLGLVAAPISAIMAFLIGNHIYFFSIISSFIVYILLYECIHFMLHLPINHFKYLPKSILNISNNLINHHKIHHQEKDLPGNYGVVTIMMDLVFKTRKK